MLTLAILALTLGATPNSVYAQGSRSGGSGGANASSGDQIRDREQDQDRIQDPSTREGVEPIQDRDRDQIQEQDRDRTNLLVPDRQQDQDRTRIRIQLEDTNSSATTSMELRQMIQNRERELEREASTTDNRNQNTIRNENQVRLAVHALLASENMLGPIGPQISEIAREINRSVERTINAEIRINNRNAITRFFLGGDKNSANELLQEARQNENRIQQIEQLIDTSTNAELRLELENWLQIMIQEQERLKEVANSTIKTGGLFSWRF